MAGVTNEATDLMDGVQLRKLSRSQIQQLARQENIKANIKTEAIISQLLKKYPDGVLTNLKSFPPRTKLNKRKSAVKRVNVRVRVKQEEVVPATPPNEHDVPPQPAPAVPTGHQLPSFAEFLEATRPAATPFISSASHSSVARPLKSLPRVPPSDNTNSPTVKGAPSPPRHHVTNPAIPVQTPQPAHHFTAPLRSTSPPYITHHETHEMLRTLTDLINTTSFDPKSTSSIEYKINALDQILDDKVIPRLMKVDKDVKDMVWVRLSLQTECISRLKEEGVLPAGNLEPGPSNQHSVNSHDHPMGNKRKRTLDEESDVSRERSGSRSPSLNLKYPDIEDSPIQKRPHVSA